MRDKNKWERRETKNSRAKHGMIMHNKSVKSLAAVAEAKQVKPITPGVTRFFCGNDIMVVIKRDKKSQKKWIAGTEDKSYTTASFAEAYIQKYRTTDRREKPQTNPL